MVYIRNEKEVEVEETDPFFNMAGKTLDCLDKIKHQILMNDFLYPDDSPEKQKAYINLLKRFYEFSIPLFPKDSKELDEMEDEILNLKLKKTSKIKSGIQKDIFIFDDELEIKLRKTFIKLSRILKPYLMPVRRDDDGL